MKPGDGVGTRGSSAVMQRTPGEGSRAADTRVAGRHGSGVPWPRCGRNGGAKRCRSWRAPLVAWEQADQDQQALATAGTRLTSLEGEPSRFVGRGGRCRGGWQRVGGALRQPELELAQEGARDRTPAPRVPDLVEACRQDVLEKAADARQRR